ncbi:MAG: hypothetical protein BMS9Abin08_0476 [Gammaproteobacteria bacterium]|nr:MAG: hypothetical protein BMS9Abin08_0476 [Gammaproteobacteria bacterium]
MRHLFIAVLMVFAAQIAGAEGEEKQEPVEQAMNNLRLQTLINRVAEDVDGRPGFWEFTLQGYRVSVITDERADRMRIIVPVAKAGDIDSEKMKRLMQANFDSALDARYSIAKGILWSAFIHPLSELSDHQFIDGLAQTVNLAGTFGTSYSSGALIFGGGDSKQEQDRHYREIIERESAI